MLLFVDLQDSRQLFDARTAPRGPEVNEHDLALQLAYIHLTTVHRRKFQSKRLGLEFDRLHLDLDHLVQLLLGKILQVFLRPVYPRSSVSTRRHCIVRRDHDLCQTGLRPRFGFRIRCFDDVVQANGLLLRRGSTRQIAHASEHGVKQRHLPAGRIGRCRFHGSRIGRIKLRQTVLQHHACCFTRLGIFLRVLDAFDDIADLLPFVIAIRSMKR